MGGLGEKGKGLPAIRSASALRSGARRGESSPIASTSSSQRKIQIYAEDQTQKRRIFALKKLSQRKVQSTANTSPDFSKTARYLNKCPHEFTDRIKSLREKRMKPTPARLKGDSTVEVDEDHFPLSALTDRGSCRLDASIAESTKSPTVRSPQKRVTLDMGQVFDFNENSAKGGNEQTILTRDQSDTEKLPVIPDSIISRGSGKSGPNSEFPAMKELLLLHMLKPESNESLDNAYAKTNHMSELRDCRKKYERIIELNTRILSNWAKIEDRRDELDKLCSFLREKFKLKIKNKLAMIGGIIGPKEVKEVTEEITGHQIGQDELENLVELMQIDSLTATKDKITEVLASCNDRQAEIRSEIRVFRDRLRILMEEEKKLKQRRVIAKEGPLNKLENEKETLTEQIVRLESTSDQIDQYREENMIKLSMLHKLPSPRDPFNMDPYDGGEMDSFIAAEEATLEKPRQEFFSTQSPARPWLKETEEPRLRKRPTLMKKKTESNMMPRGLTTRAPTVERLRMENVFQKPRPDGRYPFFSQRNKLLET